MEKQEGAANSNTKGVQIQRALDARHGRVLLSHYSPRSTRESEEDLVVCDPVKGDLRTLPWLYHWCRDD